MSAQPRILAVATMDTKGEELAFVAQRIADSGVAVVCVDVSTTGTAHPAADVPPAQILAAIGQDPQQLAARDRGSAVGLMGDAFAEWLSAETAAGRVAGVIGLGGSGGTALITRGLRALPVGLPKLMVSTVASGNTSPYVDCSDICMMYSVVDVAGLNAVSMPILSNAAAAIAAMATRPPVQRPDRPAVGMTMFGVTTDCVTAVRRTLESRGCDCLVFHATGTGGRAMEKLVASGLITGVLDITTTEVADELVGGVFPAGPDRFEAILASKIPYVVSLGALDMVNFGARDTVPEPFQQRCLYQHNEQVTLMRTNADELTACARWMTTRFNRSSAPLTVLIPEGGLSAIDAEGQPFHDPDADAALFAALEDTLDVTAERRLLRSPHHINAPEFAELLVAEFLRLANDHQHPPTQPS